MRVVIFLCLIWAGSASAYCRQALVLALDVSGSVNGREYYQQIEGLSRALSAPVIRQAILQDPASFVSIAAFEWSSQNHQGLITGWREIHNEDDLRALADTIANHRKQRQGLKTAIGRALEFSAALLSQRPDCLKRTVDISGDGENNVGPVPSQVYSLPDYDQITVNALVIGDPSSSGVDTVNKIRSQPGLKRYFETHVIHGPGAFAEIASGYEDYARAMEKKLLRELALPVFGDASGHSFDAHQVVVSNQTYTKPAEP